MKEFNINGQKFFLHVSWEDVTVEQFIKINNNPKLAKGDVLELASILSGVDYDFFFELDPNVVNIDEILECLTFVKEIPDFKKIPLPSAFHIAGRPIEVPTDLTIECWGQKIMFEEKMSEALKLHGDPLPMIDQLLAIYFCNRITGKQFSEKDLPEATRLIGLSKITEAYPIANFFLNKYFKSITKIKSSLPVRRTRKKLQPA
jgi:hypothetical protein